MSRSSAPDAVLRVLLAIAIVLVLLVSALWLAQRRLIYFPDTSAVPRAGDVLPGAQDVTLETSDGLRLGAWFVPGSPVVLVAPGNAGNRAGRAPLAADLARAGLGVLLLDYRGYGGNPGSPSETGLALDVRAAYRFLTEDRRVPREKLIYFGESLGSAVVTELATEHPPAAMLLRSPFVDLAATGQEHYPFLPVRLLLRDKFPVAATVARVKVPITVVLGTDDSVVPADQSRQVARAGSARLIEITGADHNDPVLTHGPEVIDAVTTLLR